MPTPAVRKPGSVWTELPRPVSAAAEPVGHVRLGYARASTAQQSLDAQLDYLAEAGCPVMLAEELKASDVVLEFLTGELKGSHGPSGIVFTVESMLFMALHLRDPELSLRDIANRLVITTGAKKG